MPRTRVHLGNRLNLVITRMGADSRGRSKQERSGVAPNKEEHVTEYKPKQTNQTESSVQQKHAGWYHRKPKADANI